VYNPDSYEWNPCVQPGTGFLVPVYDWKSPDAFKVQITTQNQERNPRIHNKKTGGEGMAVFWARFAILPSRI
jgi:hypothetical protein